MLSTRDRRTKGWRPGSPVTGRWRLAGHPRLAVPLLFLAFPCLAASGMEGNGADLTQRMTLLVLQLAAILVAAKAGGVICARYLKLPEVLGELAAGMLIGPYALGPWLGLFASPAAGAGGMPLSPELYGFATVASILLLYLAGLETDIGMFLRYSVPGSLVGVGGVVCSFIVGDVAAVWTGFASSYTDTPALLLGTISTATSVGITARVLSERNKIDSPEGVTILAGAVVDDVLGIVALAVVMGIARSRAADGALSWAHVGWIALRAGGFWVVCTALGLLLARRLGRVLEFFGSRQTMATLSFGLALLVAGLAEKAHLAMIIGAYITGLSLSRVDAAGALRQRLAPMYHTLVAVFFAVMGMMVNVREVRAVLGVGLLYAGVAMLAKVVGCGLPALCTRFNARGALRIGVGMLPRGEVTLLIAGVALTGGFIGPEIFGVAVLMTLSGAIAAPLLMARLFGQGSGLRDGVEEAAEASVPIALDVPSRDLGELLVARILETVEQEGCYIHQLEPGEPFYQVRKDDIAITVRYSDGSVILSSVDRDREFARLILLEALAGLVSLFDGLRQLQATNDMRHRILGGDTDASCRHTTP